MFASVSMDDNFAALGKRIDIFVLRQPTTTDTRAKAYQTTASDPLPVPGSPGAGRRSGVGAPDGLRPTFHRSQQKLESIISRAK
jgi:hypothetical protein